MTIDEAIKHCKEVAEEKDKSVELYKAVKATEGLISKCETCAEEHRQLAEWLKELKAYREQQLCEDCISREMAMKECYTIHDDYGERFDVVQLETLEGLPSVTPARAEGKWEYVQYDRPTVGNYHCSLCKFISNADYHFCPNCGADMRGEEE